MSEEVPGFGLIMPLPEPGLESLGHLLSRAESPSFPVLISIARQLVSAFEGLHEAAMCYRDIGLGTILVDADQGAVALVDIDAIAPDHSVAGLSALRPRAVRAGLHRGAVGSVIGPCHRGAVALGPGAAGGLRLDLFVPRIGLP